MLASPKCLVTIDGEDARRSDQFSFQLSGPLSSEYGNDKKDSPDPGLGFEVKVLETFLVVCS